MYATLSPMTTNATALSGALPGNARQTDSYVIAVMNQKGGVGKTMVTLSLAAHTVAAYGRALVVDVDPQANAHDLTWAMQDPGYEVVHELDPAQLTRIRQLRDFDTILVDCPGSLEGRNVLADSGSLPVAGARGRRRAGREGAPAWSAAWTAAATSCAVSASTAMFRRSSTRRTTCPACRGASCGPAAISVLPVVTGGSSGPHDHPGAACTVTVAGAPGTFTGPARTPRPRPIRRPARRRAGRSPRPG
jgi:AAA domain